MLTLPEIVDRAPQPYVAIREKVRAPFNDVVDRVLPELFERVARSGIPTAGPAFFRYTWINMPNMEIEFGVPTESVVQADERLVAGTLPGGRYATLTYYGHYAKLLEANTVLIGWAKQKQLRWDVRESPQGDSFGCRLEIYETDPVTEPDPSKWETVLAIRLAD